MSDRRWITNHTRDTYVIKAQKDGYRSRASYKLIEIDDKYRLFNAGKVVLDLGAAPGGWSQVALQRSGDSGLIVAVDLLAMDAIAGVVDLKVDFTEPKALSDIAQALDGRPLDVVMSDMAPNLSGVRDIDQPRSTYLVELAIDIADEHLKVGGSFVAKCFEGEGIDRLRMSLKARFEKVINIKPKASRPKSREIYLVGLGKCAASHL